MDQNIFNSLLGHIGLIETQLSLRQIIQHFDPKAVVLNLMHTKFLQLNMPRLYADYGKRHFDLRLSLDNSLFSKLYPEMPLSGVSIDDTGNFKILQHAVAFLKVAPKDVVHPGSIDNMEDDEDDEVENEDLTEEELESKYRKKVRDFADSQNWEVARTIYFTF